MCWAELFRWPITLVLLAQRACCLALIRYVAKTADLQLMKLLVELGANIHATNADGVTPRLAAAGVGVVAVDEDAEVLESLDLPRAEI